MKVKLIKLSAIEWDLSVNGEIIGKVNYSNKYSGCYKVTFNNGDDTILYSFNHTGVKNQVTKHLEEKTNG